MKNEGRGTDNMHELLSFRNAFVKVLGVLEYNRPLLVQNVLGQVLIVVRVMAFEASTTRRFSPYFLSFFTFVIGSVLDQLFLR